MLSCLDRPAAGPRERGEGAKLSLGNVGREQRGLEGGPTLQGPEASTGG